MQLFIGNKNYSSWSMRAWVLMRHFDIPFEEVKLRFDNFTPDSQFKRRILQVSPAGRVPVLVDDDLAIWDTLAIAETLAEKFPDKPLWPQDARARARARSICAEMHSSFGDLRNHCPMNIDASLPEAGARIWAGQAGVRADIARIVELWEAALARSSGPFLFGNFSIADAFYAPVLMRIRTYALPVPEDIIAYGDRVFATRAVTDWITDALGEKDFIAFEEPYRSARA